MAGRVVAPPGGWNRTAPSHQVGRGGGTPCRRAYRRVVLRRSDLARRRLTSCSLSLMPHCCLRGHRASGVCLKMHSCGRLAAVCSRRTGCFWLPAGYPSQDGLFCAGAIGFWRRRRHSRFNLVAVIAMAAVIAVVIIAAITAFAAAIVVAASDRYHGKIVYLAPTGQW
ncbi:hypothetical protein SODG_006782 [Sodalis praecaptivus]